MQVNENFNAFMYPTQNMGNPNGPWGGPMIQQFQPNRFGYHSVGHLIVANLGQYLVAVDAVTHRKLWDKNLLGDHSPANNSLQYNATDETLQTMFTDGMLMTISQGGPVEANYVCLLTREGLMAARPVEWETAVGPQRRFDARPPLRRRSAHLPRRVEQRQHRQHHPGVPGPGRRLGAGAQLRHPVSEERARHRPRVARGRQPVHRTDDAAVRRSHRQGSVVAEVPDRHDGAALGGFGPGRRHGPRWPRHRHEHSPAARWCSAAS